jgi:hypothetical protein
MTTVIQKGDLSPTDFSNNNSNNAGGVGVKTDAASSVGIAIAAALSGGGSSPVATTTVQGIAALATPAATLAGSDNSTIVTPFTLASTLSDLGLTSRTRRYFYANQ